MNAFTMLYIFETPPKALRLARRGSWWKSAPLGKRVPYAFGRGILIASDLVLGCVAVVIAVTSHLSSLGSLFAESLFLSACTLFLLTRRQRRFWLVVGLYVLIAVLAITLNLIFPGAWGNVLIYILYFNLCYRFPLSWSLPLASVCALIVMMTNGTVSLLPFLHASNALALASAVGIVCCVCWFGWARRSQYLLIMRLHDVQEQLREQMLRSEELAAERERARIARDIHDVLSHSLAVLSIQVQAARQLATRDPERLASKLEDMASLIRESITESRQVVGLLREQSRASDGQNDACNDLRLIATTFHERTGILCHFAEHGVPHTIDMQQRETLYLALREALTNAHRHGAARAVWITLNWQEVGVSLEVRDNGAGADAVPAGTVNPKTARDVGGHHGIQGMRERAAACGGGVEAAPLATGGFVVTLKMPYDSSYNWSDQKVL